MSDLALKWYVLIPNTTITNVKRNLKNNIVIYYLYYKSNNELYFYTNRVVFLHSLQRIFIKYNSQQTI